MQKMVSVIIPCYNQGKYLYEAVDSVLCQTYSEFEIIIVNDGSSEEITINILRNFNRPKCRIINKINKGVSAARNTGIRVSQGDYILPLDSDDRIGPKYLEESVKILNEKPDIGIVYCNAEFFGAITGKINLPEFSLEKMLLRNLIFNCALFRKEDYLNTAGYNTNMVHGWEDWDFWLTLLEKGIGVYKLPDTRFYYRIKDSDSRNFLVEKDNKIRRQMLDTIFINHIDFYLKNMGNPIELKERMDSIFDSKDYFIGRSILKPLRYIKKKIN